MAVKNLNWQPIKAIYVILNRRLNDDKEKVELNLDDPNKANAKKQQEFLPIYLSKQVEDVKNNFLKAFLEKQPLFKDASNNKPDNNKIKSVLTSLGKVVDNFALGPKPIYSGPEIKKFFEERAKEGVDALPLDHTSTARPVFTFLASKDKKIEEWKKEAKHNHFLFTQAGVNKWTITYKDPSDDEIKTQGIDSKSTPEIFGILKGFTLKEIQDLDVKDKEKFNKVLLAALPTISLSSKRAIMLTHFEQSVKAQRDQLASYFSTHFFEQLADEIIKEEQKLFKPDEKKNKSYDETYPNRKDDMLKGLKALYKKTVAKKSLDLLEKNKQALETYYENERKSYLKTGRLVNFSRLAMNSDYTFKLIDFSSMTEKQIRDMLINTILIQDQATMTMTLIAYFGIALPIKAAALLLVYLCTSSDKMLDQIENAGSTKDLKENFSYTDKEGKNVLNLKAAIKNLDKQLDRGFLYEWMLQDLIDKALTRKSPTGKPYDKIILPDSDSPSVKRLQTYYAKALKRKNQQASTNALRNSQKKYQPLKKEPEKKDDVKKKGGIKKGGYEQLNQEEDTEVEMKDVELNNNKNKP